MSHNQIDTEAERQHDADLARRECRTFDHGYVFLPDNVREIHHFSNGMDKGKCERMSPAEPPAGYYPAMTIKEAYAIVDSIAMDDQSVKIGMDLWWFRYSVDHQKRGPMETEFSIGVTGPTATVRAKTLAAAVQAFIAANQPSALPEEVDALVAEVNQKQTDLNNIAFAIREQSASPLVTMGPPPEVTPEDEQ